MATICLGLHVLTHRGRDKMAAVPQTTFSNAFSWMKMFKFRLKFHWSLFARVQLTISRVILYTAGHLHTAVPHCLHSRAPIVHTAVPRENNEHGCVYLRCRAVCKLPGCVEGHPWIFQIGSDNGLAPNRRQAIIWTNDGIGCLIMLIYTPSADLLGKWQRDDLWRAGQQVPGSGNWTEETWPQGQYEGQDQLIWERSRAANQGPKIFLM